jgi:hypothetical protein
MSKILIKYDDALDLIQEGDVLLFRGKGIVSNLIQRAGDGAYSHVGLATWHNCAKRCLTSGTPLLEVTEFREGFGGRTTNLAVSYAAHINAQVVDVYRAAETLTRLKFDPGTRQTLSTVIPFDGKAVTDCMRRMTGLPYGWQRIWWIARRKLAFIRWFYTRYDITDDTAKADFSHVYPVCSTAVAACFSSIGYDLVPNRSDEWIEPSDVSRSALLNYLFTLAS